MNTRKLLVVSFAVLATAGFAGVASAQSANTTKEISTAHAHALMAQGSNTVNMAHTHLHHVINCLVGPKGAGFDAAPGDPCKGQGNGAIPDSKSNPTELKQLNAALADAKTGLKSDSLKQVHEDAAKAVAALATTSAQKPQGGYSW